MVFYTEEVTYLVKIKQKPEWAKPSKTVILICNPNDPIVRQEAERKNH